MESAAEPRVVSPNTAMLLSDEALSDDLRELLWALSDEEFADAAVIVGRVPAEEHAAVCQLRDASSGGGCLHLLYADDADEAETLPILRALLAMGCDVNARNGSGATPLMLAAHAPAPRAVQALLEAGVDASATDSSGRSAADMAWEAAELDEDIDASERAMVTELHAAGSPLLKRTQTGLSAERRKLLRRSGHAVAAQRGFVAAGQGSTNALSAKLEQANREAAEQAAKHASDAESLQAQLLRMTRERAAAQEQAERSEQRAQEAEQQALRHESGVASLKHSAETEKAALAAALAERLRLVEHSRGAEASAKLAEQKSTEVARLARDSEQRAKDSEQRATEKLQREERRAAAAAEEVAASKEARAQSEQLLTRQLDGKQSELAAAVAEQKRKAELHERLTGDLNAMLAEERRARQAQNEETRQVMNQRHDLELKAQRHEAEATALREKFEFSQQVAEERSGEHHQQVAEMSKTLRAELENQWSGKMEELTHQHDELSMQMEEANDAARHAEELAREEKLKAARSELRAEAEAAKAAAAERAQLQASNDAAIAALGAKEAAAKVTMTEQKQGLAESEVESARAEAQRARAEAEEQAARAVEEQARALRAHERAVTEKESMALRETQWVEKMQGLTRSHEQLQRQVDAEAAGRKQTEKLARLEREKAAKAERRADEEASRAEQFERTASANESKAARAVLVAEQHGVVMQQKDEELAAARVASETALEARDSAEAAAAQEHERAERAVKSAEAEGARKVEVERRLALMLENERRKSEKQLQLEAQRQAAAAAVASAVAGESSDVAKSLIEEYRTELAVAKQLSESKERTEGSPEDARRQVVAEDLDGSVGASMASYGERETISSYSVLGGEASGADSPATTVARLRRMRGRQAGGPHFHLLAEDSTPTGSPSTSLEYDASPEVPYPEVQSADKRSARKRKLRLKLLVCGDPAVGKSALLRRFTSGEAPDVDGEYHPTVGMAQEKYLLGESESERISPSKAGAEAGHTVCTFWDRSGVLNYPAISAAFFRGAAAVVLVYDSTSLASFKHCGEWLEQIRSHVGEAVPVVLLANKAQELSDGWSSDASGKQRFSSGAISVPQVSPEEGMLFCERNQCAEFFEVSALSGAGVDSAFEGVIAWAKNSDAGKEGTGALLKGGHNAMLGGEAPPPPPKAGSWLCMQRASIRGSSTLTSVKLGEIVEGETISALDYVEVGVFRDGSACIRLLCDRGWVSVTSRAGTTLFRRLDLSDEPLDRMHNRLPAVHVRRRIGRPRREEPPRASDTLLMQQGRDSLYGRRGAEGASGSADLETARVRELARATRLETAAKALNSGFASDFLSESESHDALAAAELTRVLQTRSDGESASVAALDEEDQEVDRLRSLPSPPRLHQDSSATPQPGGRGRVRGGGQRKGGSPGRTSQASVDASIISGCSMTTTGSLDSELARPTTLTVSAAQFLPSADIAENIGSICELLARAGSEGAQVVLFPECAVTSYPPPSHVFGDWGRELLREAELAIAQACREHGVCAIVGAPAIFSEKDARTGKEAQRVANTAIVFNECGEVIARQEKLQLVPTDTSWCTPGVGVRIFELCKVRCSAIICHDIRHAELARLAVLGGARVLFYLSAEAWHDDLPLIAPRSPKWSERRMAQELFAYRAQAIARAVENRAFLVHSNVAGSRSEAASVRGEGSHGRSAVIGPTGTLLPRKNSGRPDLESAELGVHESDVVVADCVLADATAAYALEALNEGYALAGWHAEGMRQLLR